MALWSTLCPGIHTVLVNETSRVAAFPGAFRSNWDFFVFRNGTSMISLIIPPKDQISRVSKMLADEFGTASNIKSRVNRLSVLGAITSVQHRLKLYTKGR